MRHLFSAALLCVAFCAGLTNASDHMFGFPMEGISATRADIPKIVGGEVAVNGKRPWLAWLVAMDQNDEILKECGGVILTTTMIATSAQCVRKAASIHVMVGDVDNTVTTEASRTIDARSWIMHPDFYYNILHNDIALVNLTLSLSFNDYIQPLKLPKKSSVKTVDSYAGKIITAHGWGGSGADPNCVNVARFLPAVSFRAAAKPFEFVDMKVLNVSDCILLLREVYYDLPKTISCADTQRGTVGVCTTDIGGPMTYIYPSDTFPSLIGIISHYEDCSTNYPNTFTFIGSYLNWIAANGGPKVIP